MAIKLPVCLDAKEASWSPRKRLFWLTWKLEASGPERLTANAAKGWPQLVNWSGGKQTLPPWHGTPFSLHASYLPTRLVPGDREFGIDGFRDAGFDEADMPTKMRWRQDGCRLSTYQCAEDCVLWNGSERRHPSADELDVLLGFPRGFTDVPPMEEEAREKLLGNTMHLGCIERL